MQAKLLKTLFLLFIVFNIGLGSFGLAETSEARYAQISKEMVTSGDYLHPTLLGIKHFHKPPLAYYITSVGYNLFGINEYGARFFLGIALVLQIYLVFKIALLLYKDEKIAFASALIYSSFPLVLIAARNLTTDAYLVTFILLSVFLWLNYKQNSKTFYLYGFYFVMGLAFLTKGPVGLIPSFLFIACWKYFNKEKKHFSLHIFLGVILMLTLSASWFLDIIFDDPKIWDYLINDHVINRATNAEQFHRSQPFWYYILLAPAIGLPWILFIITYLISNYKKEWDSNIIIKICLALITLLFLIFSVFSSKLILYILPIFPFIAILGGVLLFDFSKIQLQGFIRSYYILYALLICALITSIFYAEINVNLFQTIILILVTAGCLIYFIKVYRNNTTTKLLYLGVSFIFCLLLFHTTFSINNANTIHSFKDIAEFIQKEKGNEITSLIIYDDLIPSAEFYLDTEVITVQDNNIRTIRETQFENDSLYKKNYINLHVPSEIREFKRLFKNKDLVFLERKKSPINDSLSYLLKTFTHKVDKDKWVIYY